MASYYALNKIQVISMCTWTNNVGNRNLNLKVFGAYHYIPDEVRLIYAAHSRMADVDESHQDVESTQIVDSEWWVSSSGQDE